MSRERPSIGFIIHFDQPVSYIERMCGRHISYDFNTVETEQKFFVPLETTATDFTFLVPLKEVVDVVSKASNFNPAYQPFQLKHFSSPKVDQKK